MNKQNIYLIILIAVFGLLSLSILADFVVVLVLAYIFASLVKPVQRKIRERLIALKFAKIANTFSSVITIALFILVVVTPVSILLSKVVLDTQAVYENILLGGVDLNFVSEKVRLYSDKVSPDLNINFNQIAGSVSGFFVNNIGNIFSGTVDIALKLFLFILAMFYFLKDGKQFRELYGLISPLKQERDDKIFGSIRQAINSIMIGSMTVALAQGFVTGLGLFIFGVPNPFFFGTLAGFLALIPALGAPIVWIPAAVYLYFTKDGSLVWLYQVLWGVLAVGLIDNFLGPKMINRGIKIHQLFILLSIIGGISVFGPEGFILGPLILSVFVAIIKVYNDDTL